MLNKIKKKYKSSEIFRNVITLTKGTSLAQLIPILTAPIVYRIYSPTDYGTLGLYFAISGILSAFSTLQFLETIIISKNDSEAKSLVWFNRFINLIISLLVFIFIIFFGGLIADFNNNAEIVKWLWLMPITIFVTGQTQILRAWCNRQKYFKIMSTISILNALITPLISIGTGLFIKGPYGLFFGLLSGQVFSLVILILNVKRNDDINISYFRYSQVIYYFNKYINFPKISLATDLVGRATNNLPVFILSSQFSPAVVGAYTLCSRMLGIPISVIGSSLAEVFKQKVTELYHTKGEFSFFFKKTLKSLVLISIIPLILCLLFAPKLFSLVFSDKWIESGVIAQILVIYFVVKFIVGPLSYTIVIKNKLQAGLIKNLFTGFSMMCLFFSSQYYGFNYILLLMLFSFIYTITDLIYLSYLFKLSKEVKYD
jgi:O-antigen/teichoic acid export membrane protein